MDKPVGFIPTLGFEIVDLVLDDAGEPESSVTGGRVRIAAGAMDLEDVNEYGVGGEGDKDKEGENDPDQDDGVGGPRGVAFRVGSTAQTEEDNENQGEAKVEVVVERVKVRLCFVDQEGGGKKDGEQQANLWQHGFRDKGKDDDNEQPFAQLGHPCPVEGDTVEVVEGSVPGKGDGGHELVASLDHAEKEIKWGAEDKPKKRKQPQPSDTPPGPIKARNARINVQNP